MILQNFCFNLENFSLTDRGYWFFFLSDLAKVNTNELYSIIVRLRN